MRLFGKFFKHCEPLKAKEVLHRYIGRDLSTTLLLGSLWILTPTQIPLNLDTWVDPWSRSLWTSARLCPFKIFKTGHLRHSTVFEKLKFFSDSNTFQIGQKSTMFRSSVLKSLTNSIISRFLRAHNSVLRRATELKFWVTAQGTNRLLWCQNRIKNIVFQTVCIRGPFRQGVPGSHLFTFYCIKKNRYTSGFFSPNH